MFEELIDKGEVKVVYLDNIDPSKTKVLFGTIKEITGGSLKLVGREEDIHVVSLSRIIEVTKRPEFNSWRR